MDLSGTHIETFKIIHSTSENIILYLVIALGAGAIAYGLFWELSRGWFKKRGFNNYNTIGSISGMLYVIYTGAVVTTSTNNLGPMLFGGILALWIGVLQDGQQNKDSE